MTRPPSSPRPPWHGGTRRRLTPGPFLRSLLAAAIVAAVAAPMLRADDDTPVFGRRQAHDWITLDRFGGAVDLTAAYENDLSKNSGTSATSTDLLLTQAVELHTHAAVLSPNFIDLNLAGTLGLTEEWFNGSGQASEASTGLLQGYNLEAQILRESFTPVDLTASRSQDYINQTFAGTVQSDVTQYGGLMQVNSSIIPSYLSASHIDTTQTEVGTITPEFGLTQNNVAWHSQTHPADRQTLSFDYHYSDSAQTGQSTQSLTSQEVVANHSWSLDPNGFYTLTSNVDLFSQTGAVAYNRYHFDTTLRLQHADWFETNYNYTAEQQEFATDTQLTDRLRAGFIHHLFESLTTTGNLSYGQIDRSGGGGTEDYAGSLAFDYTKKVPFGRLSANLSIGFDQQNTAALTTATPVVNQPYSFPSSTTDPIIISGTNIDPSSIKIIDANTGRLYTPGVDYLVTTDPTQIEIRRILRGAIPDSANILADYTLLPLPGNTATMTTFGLGTRYDILEGWLNGLSPYVRYFQQDQSIVSESTQSFFPDNIRDYVVGSDYRIGKFLFNAETEDHESSLYPFTAYRASAQYNDRLFRDAMWSNTLSYSLTNYPKDNNRDQFVTLTSQLDYRLTRELHLIGTVTARDQQDILYGNNQGIDTQAELRWKHRQTQIFLILHDTYLTSTPGTAFSGSTDALTLFLQFGIRREF